ncbi:MAG: hypothetical protein PHE09_13490 [Oscillospiraceae bacterium]|nr:hypothetical protein [Oscillospiraceae bacterium]
MQEQNTNILNEIYQASSMGIEATEMLLPKVHNEKMRKQICSQWQNYEQEASKAAQMLKKKGSQPEVKRQPVKKAMLWGSVQMNMLADSSTKHLAEMMIQGTTMGIIKMQKQLNDLPQTDGESRTLAEDFLKKEQQNIDQLKQML